MKLTDKIPAPQTPCGSAYKTQSVRDTCISGVTPYFTAENLYKEWGTVTVDLSFTAERGTMTSIVGPSGSGKSTVLRLIAGLETPDARSESRSGAAAGTSPENTDSAPKTRGFCSKTAAHGAEFRITLDGADITHTPPARRAVGLVTQANSLFTHLTAADNVAYGLRCAGLPRKECRERAEQWLTRFGLAEFGSRWPDTLSGGEAQRVALARTLIVQPKLVLFDEPLSALDAPLRKKLAADIRSLQRDLHFTGIMVTHDIEEARAVSDRIILVEKGRITWSGEAAAFSENLFSKQ